MNVIHLPKDIHDFIILIQSMGPMNRQLLYSPVNGKKVVSTCFKWNWNYLFASRAYNDRGIELL